jgi:lipopolysaccharide export system permease protein
MKDFKKIRKHRRLYRTGRWASRKFGWLIRAVRWLAHKLRFLRIFRFLNPFRYIKKLDWYIIKKFLGYYFFSIALIISIAIVFDFNENLSKFTEHHAPARAIIFDYYANFVPYFANLFSALFVFVAVILFTTKLASNSEIIAILASGVSFKRLLRPYMITCVLLSALSFGLSAYVIPHGTVIRQNFETMYKNKKKNTSAENVQLQVDKGVIAYMQHYDNSMKRGYGFCLDKFQDKKLVSHLTAMDIQYDTISDSKYHWKLSNWKIRKLQGMKEHITSGAQKDTVINFSYNSRRVKKEKIF